jgi:hypothetical protein
MRVRLSRHGRSPHGAQRNAGKERAARPRISPCSIRATLDTRAGFGFRPTRRETSSAHHEAAARRNHADTCPRRNDANTRPRRDHGRTRRGTGNAARTAYARRRLGIGRFELTVTVTVAAAIAARNNARMEASLLLDPVTDRAPGLRADANTSVA